MRKIKLLRGEIALIDNEDFDLVRKYRWCKNSYGYAVCAIKHKAIFMHRLIMNTPKGMLVDHIDRNPLNNQRKNLRNCYPVDNNKNRKVSKSCVSGYKGVGTYVLVSGRVRYDARISLHGKTMRLGSFDTAIEAALAYDKKAEELFGSFARKNIVPIAPRHAAQKEG